MILMVSADDARRYKYMLFLVHADSHIRHSHLFLLVLVKRILSAITMSVLASFVLATISIFQAVALPTTNGPRVDLGYATYEGTALSNGINQFLGMRFAAPPTGDLPFRLPEYPLKETGIVSADNVSLNLIELQRQHQAY